MSIWTHKVQETGPHTKGVNLPSSWVRHHELEAKDELKITEKDQKLILEPSSFKETQ
jgi:phosphate uptake regulator